MAVPIGLKPGRGEPIKKYKAHALYFASFQFLFGVVRPQSDLFNFWRAVFGPLSILTSPFNRDIAENRKGL